MKVADIIDRLLKHEITRYEAINQIKEITNGLRNKGAIEMRVEEWGSRGNDGYLKLEWGGGYEKITKLGLEKRDKVDLIIIP